MLKLLIARVLTILTLLSMIGSFAFIVGFGWQSGLNFSDRSCHSEIPLRQMNKEYDHV